MVTREVGLVEEEQGFRVAVTLPVAHREVPVEVSVERSSEVTVYSNTPALARGRAGSTMGGEP